PAARLIHTGGTKRASPSPTSIASAVEATSARAAPRNTVQRARSPAASDNVASWVLSPSSARKIEMNVVAKSFQAIGLQPARRDGHLVAVRAPRRQGSGARSIERVGRIGPGLEADVGG